MVAELFGSPFVSCVQVSPPSWDCQIPLFNPPATQWVGVL